MKVYLKFLLQRPIKNSLGSLEGEGVLNCFVSAYEIIIAMKVRLTL